MRELVSVVRLLIGCKKKKKLVFCLFSSTCEKHERDDEYGEKERTIAVVREEGENLDPRIRRYDDTSRNIVYR